MSQIESRALKIFLEAIKTYSTKQNYLYWLRRYLRHSGKASYDDLIKDEPKTIQKNLEDYVMFLKEIHSSSMIKVNFSALFLFFEMNDVILNKTKIKKLFPAQEGKVGGRGYSNEEVIKIFEAIDMNKRRVRTKPRTKAILFLLESSACRVGALSTLKVKDLKPIKNCFAVTVYSGSKYEYFTFTTPEATKAINKYLKSIKENWKDFEISNSFGTKRTVTFEDFEFFNMSTLAIQKVLTRLVRKAKVSHKTDNGRYDIPVSHGFRKRVNTILKSNKDINPALIELMMGHSTTIKLDESYLKPSIELIFKEYEKGIDSLTLFSDIDTVV